MMMKIEQYIENTLIELHKTCHTDKYGQIHKSSFEINGLFKDRLNEVIEFVRMDQSLISISTYGGQVGTYRAITIVDDVLKKKCSHIFCSENQSYHRAMTSW